jgi:hypothetical protein
MLGFGALGESFVSIGKGGFVGGFFNAPKGGMRY